jgi:hypothetical protein
MLRNRRDRLLIGDLPHILAACGFERPLSEPELSARGVVEKKVVEDLKEVLEFVHPSIYEYFLAHRLKADFLGVEKAEISPEQLSNLELGRVELDFPQSAVYGFLSELLGDEYFHILKIRLRQTFREAAPSMLARNLVEYLGMTFRGGSDP